MAAGERIEQRRLARIGISGNRRSASASDFLSVRLKPRTSISTGSPSGATRETVNSVPFVSPIDKSLSLYAGSALAYPATAPRSPGEKSLSCISIKTPVKNARIQQMPDVPRLYVIQD
jgi:hypothetical protein